MNNEEIWKPIIGYEGYYEVSNMGRVRALDRYVKGKLSDRKAKSFILKPCVTRKGYLYVGLNKDGVHKNARIHKLVMVAFVPNTDNKPFIDHINTDKCDNRVENLRWVTARENARNPLTVKHIKESFTKEEKERQKQVKIANGSWPAKKVFQYTKEGLFVCEYESMLDASRKLNISMANISKALDVPYKSVGGYMWVSRKNNSVKWLHNIHHGAVKVQQLDDSGNVIREWPTITKLSKDLNLNRHGVAYAITYGNGCYGGKKFRRI